MVKVNMSITPQGPECGTVRELTLMASLDLASTGVHRNQSFASHWLYYIMLGERWEREREREREVYTPTHTLCFG